MRELRYEGESHKTTVTLKYHSFAAANNVAQSLVTGNGVEIDNGYIESATIRTVTEIRLSRKEGE